MRIIPQFSVMVPIVVQTRYIHRRIMSIYFLNLVSITRDYLWIKMSRKTNLYSDVYFYKSIWNTYIDESKISFTRAFCN